MGGVKGTDERRLGAPDHEGSWAVKEEKEGKRIGRKSVRPCTALRISRQGMPNPSAKIAGQKSPGFGSPLCSWQTEGVILKAEAALS